MGGDKIIVALEEALREAHTEVLWCAYHQGFTDSDNRWTTALAKDAEWLARQVGLECDVWHDAEAVEAAIPAAVEAHIERIKAGAGAETP